MPYDPRAAALTQFGIGMLGQQLAPPGTEQPRPQQPQRPKQWWEMMPQMRRPGQGGQQGGQSGMQTMPYVSNPGDAQPGMQTMPYDQRNSGPPSLLQMLMLGGGGAR